MFLNRFPQTYMPLLWPLGRSPPLPFYNAVVWVLYASKVSLYLAMLAFAAGAVYGFLRGLVDWVFPAWMLYVEYATQRIIETFQLSEE
jgi:hypothetical protein